MISEGLVRRGKTLDDYGVASSEADDPVESGESSGAETAD